jgi:thiamine biosynthesis lipoprotein
VLTRYLAPALLLLAALGGCGSADHVYQDQFLTMGTVFNLEIYGIDDDKGQEISRILQKDLEYMNFAWHAWKPGSLGRVNQLLASGGEFSVNPSVLPLIVESRRLYHSSQGLFNPAIGGLIGMWGFHSDDPSQAKPPSDAAIRDYMKHEPTMDDIEIDGIRARGLNPQLRLDFGAFAKGYAVEQLLARLREMGVENAIINAGGDLKAIGSHGSRPWKVAVRDPKSDGIVGSIEVSGDTSVFTSGNYERYFKKDGKRYAHIIDPRTGYPAQGTASVTVIDDNAAHADAAATALYVAGPDKWWEIARSMGIKYVMLIDDQGTIYMNPAMAKRIQLEPKFQSGVKLSKPLS